MLRILKTYRDIIHFLSRFSQPIILIVAKRTDISYIWLCYDNVELFSARHV